MRPFRTLIALCLVLLLPGVDAAHATQLDSSAVQASDPTQPGPLSVGVIDYDAGATVIASQSPTHPGASVQQLRGTVFLPAGAGPFPVIVLVHGRHGTCHIALLEDPLFGSGTFPGEATVHPCPATPVSEEIVNHRGYDYIAQNLASHGYLVAAIDVNGVNSYDNLSSLVEDGQYQRAELIARHLDLLHGWNVAPGPGAVGLNLLGKVDLSRIGLMGHSRGGEGVMAFVDHNRTRIGRQYPGLTAVFALAPTNFHNQRPSGVNFATLLPLCDGDVFDLQGAGAYDDGRFDDPNEAFARAQYSVRGANHNYFNDVWAHGAFPDDSGFTTDSACDKASATSLRLSVADQQAIGLALVSAFLRRHVGGETTFDDLTAGRGPLPAGACPSSSVPCDAAVLTSYLAPTADRQLVVTPADGAPHVPPATTDTGGPLSATGFDSYSACTPGTESDAITRDTALSSREELFGPFTDEHCPTVPEAGRARQLTLSWSAAAALTAQLSATGFDADDYRGLSFRTGANFDDDPATVEAPQDFEVVLVDADEVTASVSAASYTKALLPPDGDVNRRLVLNGAWIPLSAFPGVDLTRLTRIELRFGGLTATGSVQLAELAFQK